MNDFGSVDAVRKASHDVRGALSSILGFASLMNTDWDQISEDEKRQFIAIIDRQARRMTELVDELVTLVKDRTGAGPPTHVGARPSDS